MIMAGIPLMDLIPVVLALGLESCPRLSLADAMDLSKGYVPPFPPDVPALITGIHNGETAAGVRRVLSSVYPGSHTVKFVAQNQLVEEILLEKLTDALAPVLYVPPLGIGTSLEAFQEIVAHLRAPEGCPWDKEQTHLTLRKHLLEESYEALSAMDEESPAKMREEFGDLLLQIVLNAQIGSEYDGFNMAGVLQGIYEKIVRRHPHVFGDLEVAGVGQVLSNWEKLKREERKSKGEAHKGILDGLPAAFPALTQAQEFQDRAARVGFDWPEIDGVLEKVKEEIDEVRAAQTEAEFASELGDLFFSLVNLSRWKKVDAEAALREANLKFKRRFQYIERRTSEMGKSIQSMSLNELDGLWNEAKRMERI
jgi:tetrapyrrole methylase family protein / MazG family protein